MKAYFKLLGLFVVSLGMAGGGALSLRKQWSAYTAMQAGSPVTVQISSCVKKESNSGRKGKWLNEKFECQAVSGAGRAQSIQLNKRLVENFSGKPVRASLLPGGAFAISEPSFIAHEFSFGILLTGLGLSFLVGLFSKSFRRNFTEGVQGAFARPATQGADKKIGQIAGGILFAAFTVFAFAVQHTMIEYIYFGCATLVILALLKAKFSSPKPATRTTGPTPPLPKPGTPNPTPWKKGA